MIIFLIALLVFGPKKLPELGKTLGKGLAEFKRASNELRNTLEEEVRLDEQRTRTLPPAPPQLPAGPETIQSPAKDAIDAVSPPHSTDEGPVDALPAPPETIARGEHGS